VHTWPPGQPPAEIDVGAHARATCPQTAGVVVAAPPLAAQVPPDATGAATVTLIAPSVVGSQLDVTVCVPSATVHESSTNSDITGPWQDSPVTAPQEHVVHVAGEAVRSALPSKTGVAAKPAPQDGGACPTAAT
jgi:hypothetical protein